MDKPPQSAKELEQFGRPGFIVLGLVLAVLYFVGLRLFVPPQVGRELQFLPILGLLGFSFVHALYVVRARWRKR